MPDGEQWWFIKDGKGFKKETDGTVRPLLFQEVFNIQSYCSPMGQVTRAIRDSKIEVSSLPPSTRHGRPVLDVRIRIALSFAAAIIADLPDKKFYINSKSSPVITA